MAPTSSAQPSRNRVREHRKAPAREGLRPIEISVPGMRSATFRSEAHRQSAAVAASAHAREDQAFIGAVSQLG